MINTIILLIMTLLGAFGSLLLKKAAESMSGINRKFIVFFLCGGFLYFFGALLNIYLLQKLPYSLVYPLTSITYIWTVIISTIFLSERITARKIAGVGLIVFGALLFMLK